ncbi:MAG: hypothetical protein MH472_06060 [Bacteroidia bacterium]|nr:hypothetical protein [Bacteroidia bacterium]
MKFTANETGGNFSETAYGSTSLTTSYSTKLSTSYAFFAQYEFNLLYLQRGNKNYELTNHTSTVLSTGLGNVLAVITDKRLLSCMGDTIQSSSANIVSATDYSPFGAPLAGRVFSANEYRFGFNGQEKDDEVAGVGNIMTAEFWEYDCRLGRRWNLDPVPDLSMSGYLCFANNPIFYKDVLGNTWKDPEKDGKVASEMKANFRKMEKKFAKNEQKFLKKFQNTEVKGNATLADLYLKAHGEAYKGKIQMQNAISEIDELEKSSKIFTFNEIQPGTNEQAQLTFESNGTTIINYYRGSFENLAHETKHGYQIHTGQIEGVPGTNKTLYDDLTDEKEAYIRQYFISPFSLPDNPSIKVTYSTDISTTLIEGMESINNNGQVNHQYRGMKHFRLDRSGQFGPYNDCNSQRLK